MFKTFINDFITLLVAIDPIGTVPLLAAMTHKMDSEARSKLVGRGVLIATLVLLGFAIFGNFLLKSMGISFSSFRIAGGIILFIVGLQMVFQDHSDEMKHTYHEAGNRDLAVFPIALPYIAGPGAMLATMVQTQGLMESPAMFASKLGALLLVMALAMVTLMSSVRVIKILGKTGSEVIGRVMGILLAALAAESVVRGLTEAWGRVPT
jgi:multiple antibiotic resistance protein